MTRAQKKTTRRTKKLAKRSKKKAVRSSTTRSTAGPGFDFEDHVAAWLLLNVLTGQPLPGIEGTGARLQTQVEALGWAIDDILFTAAASPDDERHLAISCKSNVQVTASRLPADFVMRCWKQWIQTNPNPMQHGKDRLMLATRGRNNAFMATWSDLKEAAPGSDVALALGRMSATAKHRTMFESVRAPAKDVGVTVSDADVVAMIDSMLVIPVDFHIADSESKRIAVAQSRGLLENGSLAEGQRLWMELVAQARNTRLGSGTLDISEVWRLLRRDYALKDHPNYAASWQRLRALTQDHKATIETALPSGLTLDRKAEIDKLLERTATDAVCVVFGESGSGKSALVKSMLDERFPNAAQVWFSPDTLDLALNESTRASLGIDQPLISVLDATVSAENYLVIDAAERVTHDCALKATALIEALTRRNASNTTVGWHILVIGQTEAWVGRTLQELVGKIAPTNVEVEPLPLVTVRDVLLSVPSLRWLATHSDAVSALTNLRTLAWVIQAAARFHGQEGSVALSLTAIADRLWTHWTDNKVTVQRLLLRLAEREAHFEHSFAISQLESGDAAVLDDLPVACPLRKDAATGRIQFEHDLAADWARFQRLKEIATDTAQWAQFAGNPFWHNALRMLGQLLLRQQVGTRSAWDIAFEFAEQNRHTSPLADDMLLDALFLDPNAEEFLNERADMLFANDGRRLLRLVSRFEHIASVPGASPDMRGRFRHLSLYIEAHLRTPIFARWPAMARFLAKYRDRVAKLMSSTIASLCDRWLTSTPPSLPGGDLVPLRREFADLALATAREVQLGHAKGIMFLDESEKRIYQAALAAAPDLPSDVSEWTLEMARRRPYRADIVEQVRAHREEQAAEHRRRLESDPAYRERHERREGLPISLPSGRRLPPWPLGPRHRIEGRFREAIVRSAGSQALMRTDAAVAGEVLLACIIEDEPTEEYGSSRNLDHELGIEFDDEGYPTAPWKSPFYAFLQIDPDAALGHLHQLVNFATDRWVNSVRKHNGSNPASLSLRLPDEAVHEYAGNGWVFAWSHQNSLFIGQLHSALAALERWLCDLIDAGSKVAPRIDDLLRATNSVAVLGVLVNVGKYRDDLFKGPLRPLLSVQQIYDWDRWRVQDNASGFDAAAWARSGEIVFEMAKNWASASYRKRMLREIVHDMVVVDSQLGDFVTAASSHWISPNGEKEALEFRILVAELDHGNYSPAIDSQTGKQAFAFSYPPDVAAAIAKFEQDKLRLRQALIFPQTRREVLGQTGMLKAQQAQRVASLMAALDGDEKIDLDEDLMRAPRVAAAAMLLLRAPEWLVQNSVVYRRAQSIIDAAIAGITDESGMRGARSLMAPSHLEFAAHLAAERWIAESSKENDERVLRLLTSGDDTALQVLVWAAYQNHAVLRQRWWRILYVALLWSGLSMLRPGYDDEADAEVRWQRCCRWLRTRSLSAEATLSSINPLAVAERIERLQFRRWRRRQARDGRVFTQQPRRRRSGLDTDFLKSAFAWLFRTQADRAVPADELGWHRQLVAAFWSHEAWLLLGSGEDDNDAYRPMHGFGYAILEELARLTADGPTSDSPALWRPVFALGAKGHYAVRHFLASWFAQLTEASVVGEFAQRWRPMIEFMVVDSEWSKGGPWYYGQQLERQVLGFGESSFIRRVADHAALVGMMRDLYGVWARRRLTRDEDNLAGFCGFLADEVGKLLRLDGLQWIADAMRANPDVGKWFRDRTSSAFMEFLDVLVSEHAAELVRDDKVRQALLYLSAHAVSRQLTAALALHERIRRLF